MAISVLIYFIYSFSMNYPPDFENSSVPDAIWYTLTERRETNLPSNLLVIYDTGSDEFFCLDFNQYDYKGEPRVVSFLPGVK